MAKPKFTFAELVKFSKKINKKGLTDEIDIDDLDDEDDDFDELCEELVQAVERIDDAKKQNKLTPKIVEFYEKVLAYVQDGKESSDSDEFDTDELEDKLDDLSYKEMKDFIKENELEIKTKVKKKTFEDKQDKIVEEVVEAMKAKHSSGTSDDNEEETKEFDADELEDKLEDMDFDEIEKFCEKNGLDLELDEDEYDDDEDEVIKQVVKAMKKKHKKKGGKKDKKDKKNKKDKKGKDDDGGKYPKGWKKTADPAKMFDMIKDKDGECTVADLAVILAKGKKKDAPKKYNAVVHNLARKFQPKVGVVVTFKKGGEDVKDGIVTFDE